MTGHSTPAVRAISETGAHQHCSVISDVVLDMYMYVFNRKTIKVVLEHNKNYVVRYERLRWNLSLLL